MEEAACVLKDLLEYIAETENAISYNLMSYEIFDDLTLNIRAHNVFMILPDIIKAAKQHKLTMTVNLANMKNSNTMRYIKRVHIKEGVVQYAYSYNKDDIAKLTKN